jgi:hypothetical protein
MQVSNNEHHREKQHDRAEVNEVEGILYAHGTRREHQYGADDRRTGGVNFHSRKFAQGKDHVARNENRIRA